MANTIDQEAIRKAVENTPLLSPNASLLLRLTAEPDHDLADVVNVVRFDSALTARVLRVVNSAAFSLMNTVHSIDRAISYLGEKMVVGIAIADSAGKLFEKSLAGYESARGTLWSHDLCCAFASREVARFARQEFSVDLAFTGGLLHDIGKAILSDFLQGTSQKVLEGIDRGELEDYLKGEAEILGLDHALIGYEIAKTWELPESLQKTILYHHRPGEAEEALRPLVYAVHLGDLIAMMSGHGTGSDSMQYPLDQGYTDYFDVSSDTLAQIMLTTQEEFKKAEATLAFEKEVQD